jgi:thiamine biosynthesis lipoprotein
VIVERVQSMGCEVLIAGADVQRVRALFERYDATFSRFRRCSELSRVNAQAGRVVRLSRLFARSLELALELAHETNGLLDPTVGAAVEAAGYDRDFPLLGDDPSPAGDPAPGCFAALRLDGRMLLAPAGVRLDLNGVVKALAVDEAAASIDGEGFVSAGGDLAVRGALDVALPAGGAVRVLEGGLATSGSTKRRWRRGGAEQHHLIDPRSGRPSTSCWREVTVSGVTCVAADSAAKAAFLLGADGPAWLDEREIPGRFVALDGAVVESRVWARSVQRSAACT